MTAQPTARRLLIAGAALASVLAVAGCGSDDSSGSGPATTSKAPATVPQAGAVSGPNADKVCVRNAGDRVGVSQKATDKLKKAGITVTSEAKNLYTSSIVENTVMYAVGQDDLAKKVQKNLGEKAELEPRPQGFDPCDGAVVVVLK